LAQCAGAAVGYPTPASRWLASLSPESPAASKIRLRFSVWQNRLPIDALPVEGWMELQLLPEHDLAARER